MNESSRFLLRALAGALLAGVAGFAVDAAFGVAGFWIWGGCAGLIAGALMTFLDEPMGEPTDEPIEEGA